MNQLADPAPGRPAGISSEEWQLRQDLAACCQLADVYGMSDMVGNIWQVMARISPHANCLLECYSRTLKPQP